MATISMISKISIVTKLIGINSLSDVDFDSATFKDAKLNFEIHDSLNNGTYFVKAFFGYKFVNIECEFKLNNSDYSEKRDCYFYELPANENLWSLVKMGSNQKDDVTYWRYDSIDDSLERIKENTFALRVVKQKTKNRG